MTIRPSVDERANSEDCRPVAPFRIRSLDKTLHFDEDEEMFDGMDFIDFDEAFTAAQQLATQFNARTQIVNKFSNSVESIEPANRSPDV